MGNKRLTQQQIDAYHEDGYILGLDPIFDAVEVAALNDGMEELLKLLEPGETALEIREWHEASSFLYDICMNEQILDYVEDLIGPNFFMWGSSFFNKDPHSPKMVGWHQDSFYWPLDPPESCTVWLSFNGSDRENAAMRVLPGSHKDGIIKHQSADETDSVLTLECDTKKFSEDEQVFLELPAGAISIHDDKIIHGSLGNDSDHSRIGLTIRYSKTHVKCDLDVNPFFRCYHCRGVDEFNHNPRGPIPRQNYARIHKEYRNVETKLADEP